MKSMVAGVLIAFIALIAGCSKGDSTGAAPTAGSEPDAWLRKDTTSKLNDTPGVQFSRSGNEIGESGADSIVVGCEDGKSYLYIDPASFKMIVGDDFSRDGKMAFKRVDLRLDTTPAQKIKLQLGGNLKTLGWWGVDVPAQARKLAHAQHLVIQYDAIALMQTYTFTLTFDLAGLDKKLAELTATCKWAG